MQPLVPYLLGKEHPPGRRVTDSQKSFRAADIEEVGDNRHTTFFEMLGNWSLGDYFKKEQLPWFYEFLITEVGLDPQRLYATVFDGDPAIGVPRDEEAIEALKKIFASAGVSNGFQAIGTEENGYKVGMESGARIFSYEAKKNWWSRSGVPANMPEGEPGGPDSEVFYDFGTPHDTAWGPHCHPNCDCGRFMEIGNSVFMEYVKKEGVFEKLAQQNVDFGGGLERIVAAKNNDGDVFKSSSLAAIVGTLERMSGSSYADKAKIQAFRIVADHMRGAVFMIADGVLPSNTEQGYFLRRLLRRSVRYADVLGVPAGELASIVAVVDAEYGEHYSEVREKKDDIKDVIQKEETKFRETLERGMKEFEKLTRGGSISGTDAFVLFTTYGFPIELTQEIAKERGATVDMEVFEKEMKEHRDASRAGAEKRFKGGLADTSEETTRLHTAHHLLLKALQTVLGPHVKQRGSNITGERLRIDFSHGEKMTDEQKREVERIVNEQITNALPVIRSSIPREEAEKLGAEMEFGAKYPDVVSVYSVGPRDASEAAPHFEQAFSLEFCGGPHVENTAELSKSGVFKIQKEEASSAGVRRIKAVLA
jgi:alanyl-tRNA synthetase